jgi:hypothetical protein
MKCYILSIALYGAETWTLRKVDQKYLEHFEMWCWRSMEKISWTDRVKNEESGRNTLATIIFPVSDTSMKKADKDPNTYIGGISCDCIFLYLTTAQLLEYVL